MVYSRWRVYKRTKGKGAAVFNLSRCRDWVRVINYVSVSQTAMRIYLRQGGYVFVVVCLIVCLLATLRKKKRQNGFAWNFQGRLTMVNEQLVKFWWRSGSPSGYRDFYWQTGSTESGINWLRCATLQCRHHHSNYDVIMSPAFGGGMHCPRASSLHLKLSASYRHTSAVRTVSLIKKEDLYKKTARRAIFLDTLWKGQ